MAQRKKLSSKEKEAELEDLQVKALFLGPKSENRDYFKSMLTFLMDEHMHWRRDFHPEDPDLSHPKDMRKEVYQQTRDRITDTLLELSSRLKQTSMPWFSARYLGHMNSDTLMVANLAYMATILYNPNNCAYEGSPATTPMEIEVGKDFALMLGFDPETAWGHITTDGTIANYEGLWMARNLKSFPLAVKKVCPDLVKGMDDWELLNLPTWRVLDLVDTVKMEGIFDKVRDESVRGVGSGEGKLGVVIVPQSKHYSWVKAVDVLGIGKKNQIAIQVDQNYRMDVDLLKKKIDELTKKRIPVMAVIAVVGTTEEGAIDNIGAIAKLRDTYEKAGISFYFHIDAAFGGYSRTLFLNENGRFMNYRDMKKSLCEKGVFCHMIDWPSKSLYESYKAIGMADSITIDPHKMGYIPYAAGGIAVRDRRILDLISYFAAYVVDAVEDSPPLLGSYIMEGSKSGAAAAAVWTTHRTVPLNITGYGQIIGRSIEMAQIFTQALKKTRELSVNGRTFIVEPLVESPDFNIVCMAFNGKGNTNLDALNALNQRIYNESSYVSGPVYMNNWITSKTTLTKGDYGDAPVDFVKRLGIPKNEWDRVQSVYVLRLCMLNPFIAHYDNLEEVWKNYLEEVKRKIARAVQMPA